MDPSLLKDELAMESQLKWHVSTYTENGNQMAVNQFATGASISKDQAEL